MRLDTLKSFFRVIIMHSQIKDNNTLNALPDPPMPSTPRFDAKEIAAAKPVQPLGAGYQLNQRVRHLFSRSAVLVMLVAIIVSSGVIATAFLPARPTEAEVSATPESSGTETIASPTSLTEAVHPAADIARDQRSSREKRRMKKGRPPFMMLEARDDGKPKPRLVTTIQSDH